MLELKQKLDKKLYKDYNQDIIFPLERLDDLIGETDTKARKSLNAIVDIIQKIFDTSEEAAEALFTEYTDELDAKLGEEFGQQNAYSDARMNGGDVGYNQGIEDGEEAGYEEVMNTEIDNVWEVQTRKGYSYYVGAKHEGDAAEKVWVEEDVDETDILDVYSATYEDLNDSDKDYWIDVENYL